MKICISRAYKILALNNKINAQIICDELSLLENDRNKNISSFSEKVYTKMSKSEGIS